MKLPARVQLVTVDRSILSSYDGRTSRKPLHLSQLGDVAKCPADVAAALLKLKENVALAGGVLRITDLYRSHSASIFARAKYNRWLSDGQPTGAAYLPAIHKNAFVSPPGFSWHNGGRAIDVGLEFLDFPVPKDEQLDVLWEVADPIGWLPIIEKADERASEAWHLEFRGPWTHVKKLLGYKVGAMCAVLDIGGGEGLYSNPLARSIQAQCHRCGQNVGKIDGDIGPKTRRGLNALGLPAYTTDPVALFTLPSKGY